MKDLLSKEAYNRLIQDYDTWLFDCDGVIWHGDQLIEGVVQVLSYLRSQSLFTLLNISLPSHRFQISKLYSSLIMRPNLVVVIRANLINWVSKQM